MVPVETLQAANPNAIYRKLQSIIAILLGMKTVILSQKAEKQLDSLPEADRIFVTSALDLYAMTGHGDVKRLTGRDGYRMRVGGYRVLFDEDRTTILAIYIGRRATTTYKRN